MRFTRLTALTPLCFLAAAALLPLTGCGSGSGDRSVTAAPVGTGSNITRETEEDFSVDAKVLAFRQATGPLLSADAAAQFDGDLAKIRAQYNQVTEVHARLDFALTDLLIQVKKGTTTSDKWEAGTVMTGEAKLDQLLTQYAAVSVSKLADTGDSKIFRLKLGQSVNVPVLIPVFEAASASLVSITQNATVGSRNDITYAVSVEGTKTYTFSVGAGDCPSGCITRQFYTVTLSPSGALSLVVTNK